MGNYRIQVPVIVNSNTAQVLVVTEIPLDPPAYRIDEIHKMIEIDDSIARQVVVMAVVHSVAKLPQELRRPRPKNGASIFTGGVSCHPSATAPCC